MEMLQNLAFAVFVCVASVILTLFLIVVAGLTVSKKRNVCPACGQKSLQCTDSFRVNPPPSYSFYTCENCNSQYIRVFNDQEKLIPRSGSKWERHPAWNNPTF